ncbi:MAG TPA: RNA polymerase sigma factor SigJ [Gemmatimonadaceae bacterium]|nr:RNA polymerase sigma factor SigJ [Gemmatimonadaceae bacterium]
MTTTRIPSEEVTTGGVVELRPRLLGLAYRMLGDYDDAEDVVQEAFLRWQSADQASVRSREAWLVTVTTRLAVDQLRRAGKERAEYPGPWLPEPIATDAARVTGTTPAPNDAVELASDLSMALLVLLEKLRPEERAAFLLREVFDVGYEEIAQILERSEDAVRQMVHRARNRVHTGRPRVALPEGEHERLLERFTKAIVEDDAEGLIALLSPDVVLATDGGGRARAALNRIVGREHVSKFLFGVKRKGAADQIIQLTRLNGEPALVTLKDGVVTSTCSIEVDSTGIRALHIMRNPEKLRHTLEPTEPLV